MHMFHDTLVSFAERRVISMKCLLVAINSKYIHSNPAVYLLRECALRDLKQKQIFGVEVELAEYTINHHASEIFDDIYLHHADLVCFSCYIWNIEYVRQLVRNLKNLCPSVKIWVGGPEVSYDCESFLRSLLQVDGVLYGEGEKSFPALIEYYAAREKDANPLSKTFPDGAAWLDENGIFHQTSPQPLTPMEDLPFIYDEAGRMDGFKNRIIYYETSRGCPFSCSYCLSSIDKKLRFRPLDTVKKELAFFLEQRVPQVKFVDRTYNLDENYYLPIMQHLADAETDATFHFEIKADLLTENVLNFLKTVPKGRFQFEIGVQTTNAATLKAINRRDNCEKLTANVKRLLSYGNIHLHLDLIAGLPYEGMAEFEKSFNDVYVLQPDMLQLGFLKVLPGTVMEKQRLEHELRYMDEPPYEILSTKYMPYCGLRFLKVLEDVFEHTYNSGRFIYTLKYLTEAEGNAFAFYKKFALWWQKRGEYPLGHNVRGVSRLLYEFAAECYAEKLADISELLRFDVLMFQPGWKPEFLKWHSEELNEKSMAFWRDAERVQRYLPDYNFATWRQIQKKYAIEYFDISPFTYEKTRKYYLFTYENGAAKAIELKDL